MRATSLLQELRGNLPIAALQQFNKDVEESSNPQEVIEDLLYVSPRCSEMLEVLWKKNLTSNELAVILTSFSHILLNIAGELKKYRSAGVHITQELLHDHIHNFYQLVSTTSINKNSRAALQCLTGMVMIGYETATEVLTNLDWKRMNLNVLLSRRESGVSRDVRAWCMYFLLAFLNAPDDVTLVKQFLQNTELLPSVFPGLVWDPCETVLNVLKVLMDSVLYNPHVSKTNKVHLFTPATTAPFLQLYRWVGPIGNMSKKGIAPDEEFKEKTLKEQEQIRNATHKFMLTLCTSYKYGIVFREKVVREGDIWSNNWAIAKILSNLESPWKLEEGKDLIVKTIGYSSDLLKPYLFSIHEILSPRATNNFVSVIDMLIRILEFQKPWKHLSEKGLRGVQVTLVPSPLGERFFNTLLESENERLRLCGMLLMKTIFSKLKETLQHLGTDKSLSREKFLSLQKYLLGNVHTYLGGVSGVIKCWQRSTGQLPFKNVHGKETLQISRTETLISIVEVLIFCRELYPGHTNEEAIYSLNMLQVVRNLTDEDDSNDESKAKAVESKIELQFLCIEFLSGSDDRPGMIVDNFILGGADNQQVEKSMLYQLIMTYSQAKEDVSSIEKDKVKAHIFTQKCLDVISNILVHNGLTVHDEGNPSFWLNYIKGNSTQLSAFLTHVIQKTVLSLSEYTDLLVELASSGLQASSDTCVSSFMKELEKMDVVDNEDISNLKSSLPFSRLVPAAVDLLLANSNSDYVLYFSQVVNDYLHTLSDPVYLADFLLEKENILTPELKRYLKYWSKGKLSSKAKAQNLKESDSLADILKHLFMSRDWASVEALFEIDSLQLLMKESDIILITQQILAYLNKELSEEDKNGGSKLTKRFVYILKNMSAVLEENDKIQSKKLTQTILEYHPILSNYQPFASPKKHSISSLVHVLIAVVLSKYPDLAPLTSPYYEQLLKDIKMHLLLQDEKVDFLNPVMSYISSEHILLSYTQVEDLFIVCLKSSCTNSMSLDNLILELLKLLLQTTSAKRKPRAQSVNLMLTKYLEWSQQVGETTNEKKQIMSFLEKLLMEVLSAEEVTQLTSDDLKALLRSDPPSSKLCCHIVKLHPPHAVTFAKKLKKQKSLISSQATILALLLDQEESATTAVALLHHLVEDLKSWALIMEEEKEGYSQLFNYALKCEIFDQEVLVEVCKNLYEKIVTKKEAPSREFLSLVPAFQKLAETGSEHKTLPLGVNLTLLHICLSSIRTLLKQENVEELLKDTTQIVNDILPSIDPSLLKKSLLDGKLWPTYVKQVLRHSFNDRNLGQSLLHTLNLLFIVMFKDEKENGDDKEKGLPSHTVYQMIFSHSHYLELMFNREIEWDQLKEKVIALQQTIVDCNIKVCEERHVPILLGAYGASMSAVDQRILKLLFTYEQNGFMKTIQPILWGEAAITHFGVQSSDNNLWNDPKPQQALALLDKHKILQTCNKFDTSLPLEPQDVQSVDSTIYDIRFLLSLMTYLANHNEVSELDYAECGAVAVGFTVMTSHSDAMWGAGAALLRFMVERMEHTHHIRLRLPWLWLVGVVSCTFNNKKHRLPSLTTQFLIRASSLISQPSHRMYQPVLNYLFLKPAFNLYEVPELFRFYNSDSIKDHYVHRSFLLSVLSTGIRETLDYKICLKKSLSTLVMGMLQAPSLDTQLRVQVLAVLESMVRILPAAVDLVKYHNLLTILPLVVLPTTSQDVHIAELLKGVLNILSAIWSTIMKSVAAENKVDDSGEQTEARKQNTDRKRKREDDTDLPSSKIAKREISNEDSGVDDLEPDREDMILEDTDEQIVSKRMVPPLFVREFLNCLFLLTPVTITCDSPESIAQYLELITENVKYIETIATLSTKALIRAVALAPDVIKAQVYENINWEALLGRLQGRITDEEELKLLGAKAEDMKNMWATEPLSKCLKKPTSPVEDNESSSEDGLKQLRSATMQLLCTLGK